MKKRSTFEWGVLGLTAAVLLAMGGWFLFGSPHAADAWQVETQRNDSPGVCVSVSREEDSLLEGEVIDLNTAAQSELERLPGIGATRAQAIVEHRQEHGPFVSVDELTQVDGIGPAILEKVRPYVSVK